MVQLRTVREAYEQQEVALDHTPWDRDAPGLTRLAALTGQSAMGVMDDVVTIGDDITHRWGTTAATADTDMMTFLGIVYAYGYIAGIAAEGVALGGRIDNLEQRTEVLTRNAAEIRKILSASSAA